MDGRFYGINLTNQIHCSPTVGENRTILQLMTASLTALHAGDCCRRNQFNCLFRRQILRTTVAKNSSEAPGLGDDDASGLHLEILGHSSSSSSGASRFEEKGEFVAD